MRSFCVFSGDSNDLLLRMLAMPWVVDGEIIRDDGFSIDDYQMEVSVSMIY